MKYLITIVIVLASAFLYSTLYDLFGGYFSSALMLLPFLTYFIYRAYRKIRNFDYRTTCKHCGNKTKEKIVEREVVGKKTVQRGEESIYKECPDCSGVGSHYGGVIRERSGVIDQPREIRNSCTKCEGNGKVYDKSVPKYKEVNVYKNIYECQGCKVRDEVISDIPKSTRTSVYNPADKTRNRLVLGWVIVVSFLLWNGEEALERASRVAEYSTLLNKLGLAWVFKDNNDVGVTHDPSAIEATKSGRAWYLKGNYDKAIQYFQLALADDLNSFGESHVKVAMHHNSLGLAWHSKGAYDEAIRHFELALASHIKNFGEDNQNVASARRNLGRSWAFKGSNDKAIKYTELALASNIKNFGEHHRKVAAGYRDLGILWASKGDYNKSIKNYELALIAFKKTLGFKHPQTKSIAAKLAAAKRLKKRADRNSK